MEISRGILTQKNKKQISISKVVTPKVIGSGQTVITKNWPLLPYEQQAIIEEWGILDIATPEQFNLEPITLCISSYVTQLKTCPMESTQTILQGVLTFGSENSFFGMNQENVVISPLSALWKSSCDLSPEIVFDIELGTILTIPACAGIKVSIRHTSFNVPANNTAGLETGSVYRINAGLSYGLSKITAVVKTDWPVKNLVKATPGIVPIIPNDSICLYSKPQFAKAFTPLVLNGNTTIPTGGYIEFRFVSPNLSYICDKFIAYPSSGIWPDIDWPSEALWVIVTNYLSNNIALFNLQHLLAF